MKPGRKIEVVFLCSAVFILSGSFMFVGYAEAQLNIDERETSGQKSQADPLLKPKSEAERYEKTYSDEDENEIFSDGSDEEPLSPEEGPYNPADQPSGAPTK